MTLIEEIEEFVKTRSEAKALGEKTIAALKELTTALEESGGAEIVLTADETGETLGQLYFSEAKFTLMKRAAETKGQTIEEFFVDAIRAGISTDLSEESKSEIRELLDDAPHT